MDILGVLLKRSNATWDLAWSTVCQSVHLQEMRKPSEADLLVVTSVVTGALWLHTEKQSRTLPPINIKPKFRACKMTLFLMLIIQIRFFHTGYIYINNCVTPTDDVTTSGNSSVRIFNQILG